MLGYCQSAALATVAETAQLEARTAPYLSQQLRTDHQWQALLADRTNYTRWVEITSGKGRV